MEPLPGCPACGSAAEAAFLEDHLDRVAGGRYRLQLCPDCGVVFSEPRAAVGADWYEQAAPLRGREDWGPPSKDWRFRQFFADAVPAGRLLDVGCGDGGFLSLAAGRGFTPTGFDYDARVLELARGRGLADVHAMEFSAFCASRRPGEFDAATLFDVLEHTPEPAAFLRAVSGLLKPGAYLALSLPNARRPLPFGREEWDFPPHHFTRWSPAAMRGFLERHGFEVLRQDAGTLGPRYLAENLFFSVLMPVALKAAKLVLFGRTAGTVTELYKKEGAPAGGLRGALSDKMRRQRLVDALKVLCWPLTYPVAAAMTVYYQVRSGDSGSCLYTLARKK